MKLKLIPILLVLCVGCEIKQPPKPAEDVADTNLLMWHNVLEIIPPTDRTNAKTFLVSTNRVLGDQYLKYDGDDLVWTNLPDDVTVRGKFWVGDNWFFHDGTNWIKTNKAASDPWADLPPSGGPAPDLEVKVTTRQWTNVFTYDDGHGCEICKNELAEKAKPRRQSDRIFFGHVHEEPYRSPQRRWTVSNLVDRVRVEIPGKFLYETNVITHSVTSYFALKTEWIQTNAFPEEAKPVTHVQGIIFTNTNNLTTPTNFFPRQQGFHIYRDHDNTVQTPTIRTYE